jgi:hypothetical protein
LLKKGIQLSPAPAKFTIFNQPSQAKTTSTDHPDALQQQSANAAVIKWGLHTGSAKL